MGMFQTQSGMKTSFIIAASLAALSGCSNQPAVRITDARGFWVSSNKVAPDWNTNRLLEAKLPGAVLAESRQPLPTNGGPVMYLYEPSAAKQFGAALKGEKASLILIFACSEADAPLAKEFATQLRTSGLSNVAVTTVGSQTATSSK